MDKVKAPNPVVEELLDDYVPLGSQTAKIGDSANGVIIVADRANPESRHSIKIGTLEKTRAEADNYKTLSGIIGQEHTLPQGKVKVVEDRRTGAQYGALIVPYVPDLQPFSRQDLYVPKYGHTRERRMGEFAGLLARIQSGGLLHGDFQAKNVGNRANGLPMVFDLEAASTLDSTSKPEDAISGELYNFYKSLAIKSLYGLRPDPLIEELENSVLNPWLDEVEHIGQLSVDMAILAGDKSLKDFTAWINNSGSLERAKARFNGDNDFNIAVRNLQKAA